MAIAALARPRRAPRSMAALLASVKSRFFFACAAAHLCSTHRVHVSMAWRSRLSSRESSIVASTASTRLTRLFAFVVVFAGVFFAGVVDLEALS